MSKECYPQVYLKAFMEKIRSMFYLVGDTPCDVFTTLDVFLKSHAMYQIYEWGNWFYLNMSIPQLLECISYDEGFDWKNSTPTAEPVDPSVLWWVGMVLVQFQWEYKVDFRDWCTYFSAKDVYDMYYPLHEASLSNAASKLYAAYEYACQCAGSSK